MSIFNCISFKFVVLCLLFCATVLVRQTHSQFSIVYSSGKAPGEGPRRFPFLRALFTQMINDRSAREYAKHNQLTSESVKSKTETKSSHNSLEHIMDDINSQNPGSLSTRTRGFFLINILSRMLKSVNFTEVSHSDQLSECDCPGLSLRVFLQSRYIVR